MARSSPDLLASSLYRIEVLGHLDARWSEWLDDFTVEQEAAGRTLLTGYIVDQAALYGLLNKLASLGMPLLSVNRAEPDAS